MAFFKTCFQISFSLGVALRAQSLFPQRNAAVYFGCVFLAINIMFAICQLIVEFYGLNLSFTNPKFFDFLNTIFKLQTVNISIEITTDIILSLAFMYKLVSGLKMDASGILDLVMSPKITKLIVGWSFGIATACASSLSKPDFAWLCK
ncbi:hypothetical protein HDV00_004799 [Rhizophlyctis rosea]|nr:hypothetical protein HDV00_004799 [Rhizophlyctis rosea]